MNKAIQYLNCSAKKNFPDALYLLANIYYFGFGVPKNEQKAIYYLHFFSGEYIPLAQFLIGCCYYNNNIEKAIYYFQLSADQKYADSANNLGNIYSTKSFKKYDIKKSIYYYTLVASLGNANAQFSLYVLYMEGIDVQQNIDLAIQYCRQAAAQEVEEAQYILGMLHYFGHYGVNKNVEKGIYYLEKSSQKQFHKALFSLAYIYHQGKNIQRDINKAIKLYIDASNIGSQFAKNNYGILFKNGVEGYVEVNLVNAIVLYKEAINKTNDVVAMYNLAHIYIFNAEYTNKNENIIKLLTDSYLKNFYPSLDLLILYLFMKFKCNYELIKKELNNCTNVSNDLFYIVRQKIQDYRLYNAKNFQKMQDYYKTIDFLYNEEFKPVISKKTNQKMNQKLPETQKKTDLNESFYEGFGI